MTIVQNDLPVSRAETEAIAWFTRMNGRPSRRERREFDDWFASDPAHEAAWTGISQTWALAGFAATDADRHDMDAALARVQEIRRERATERKARPGVATMFIAALALPLLAGWLWLEHPDFIQDLQADYVTEHGEQRDILLADGTRIRLGADTAIVEDIGPGERHVALLRGEAYFDVAHSDVPFTVGAGGGTARVLGTAFDVQMQQDAVAVTLERGSLRVTLDDGSALPVLLSPGQATVYGAAGIAPARDVDVGEAMAWRERRLVFNDARLADVLARVERNRPGRIVVLGSVADYRVSGSFSLVDSDRALASLQASVGFAMHRLGNRLVVIGPQAPP